ncbi:MAG: PilZ domain-containing protein [Terriglobia bacterium]
MILQEKRAEGAVIRAPRFPVEMSIRFHGAREPVWREGWSENISRSGIMFRCDLQMEADATVEMRFVLPAETLLGRPGAEVECHGLVARVEPPAGDRTETRLAVTIANYRFVREKTRAEGLAKVRL